MLSDVYNLSRDVTPPLCTPATHGMASRQPEVSPLRSVTECSHTRTCLGAMTMTGWTAGVLICCYIVALPLLLFRHDDYLSFSTRRTLLLVAKNCIHTRLLSPRFPRGLSNTPPNRLLRPDKNKSAPRQSADRTIFKAISLTNRTHFSNVPVVGQTKSCC